MRLVRALPDAKYAALSYVWGKEPFMVTNLANLKQFQKTHVFLKGPIAEEIPRTIRDAMELVMRLELRYLWVDALCIVQDDDKTRHDCIQNMASIYAGAFVTIVAAQGENVHYGLRGLRKISRPRDYLQAETYSFEDQILVKQRDYGIGNTPWVRRGWTFQEYIFSSKRIEFYGDSVYWVCPKITHAEDSDYSSTPTDMDRYGVDGGFENPFSMRYPDISNLGRLISAYQSRQLKYEEDVMDALAGTATALSYTFRGGLILGLPILFLDAALLWQPKYVMDRRRSSRIGWDCPPSWSWAGWKGPVVTKFWEHASSYLSSDSRGCSIVSPKWEVCPMVEWRTLVTKYSFSLPIPHLNEWYDYRIKYHGKSIGLPEGWKYYKNSEESSVEPAFYYQHASVPGVKFSYPVPMTIEDQIPEQRKWSKLLSCHTQKATFVSKTAVYQPPQLTLGVSVEAGTKSTAFCEHRYQPIPLFTLDGKKAGILKLHTEAPKDATLGPTFYELFVISREKRNIPKVGHPWPEDYTICTPFDIYNVLWVEWLDGIAYRRGLGWVNKKIWDKQKLENVHLILG